jgi:SpoIIAA-like
MVEVLPAPDYVLALRIAGTLTPEDYDRIIAEVEAKLRRHARIGVYVDMTDFDDLTAKAAAKDIRYGLSKLGDLKRFPREAVVTDKQWLRTIVRILDPLVPYVEVRAFEPSEREQALAWVSAIETSDSDRVPKIT